MDILINKDLLIVILKHILSTKGDDWIELNEDDYNKVYSELEKLETN